MLIFAGATAISLLDDADEEVTLDEKAALEGGLLVLGTLAFPPLPPPPHPVIKLRTNKAPNESFFIFNILSF
jgi:hypothetical protein